MKYTKGTPTLLGNIERVEKICPDDMPEHDKVEYTIDMGGEYICMLEEQIDAIVINPKRNIDHLIELIEAKKREEAVAFIDYGHNRNAPWSNLIALLQPYVEPRKYPVLTPEELKAVKWLVEGGFKTAEKRTGFVLSTQPGSGGMVLLKQLEITKCLCNSTWITETPINLKELLEAQEGV